MKKTLRIALIGLTTALSSLYATQSLSFSGPTLWMPGTSVTLQCNDIFTNFGGSYGLSYWLEVNNSMAPFIAITGLTYHSPFTDGNNIGTFPFPFNSTSGADAGVRGDARVPARAHRGHPPPQAQECFENNAAEFGFVRAVALG